MLKPEDLADPDCPTCVSQARQVGIKKADLQRAARYRANANHPGTIARSTQQMTAARIELDRQREHLGQHLEGDHE